MRRYTVFLTVSGIIVLLLGTAGIMYFWITPLSNHEYEGVLQPYHEYFVERTLQNDMSYHITVEASRDVGVVVTGPGVHKKLVTSYYDGLFRIGRPCDFKIQIQNNSTEPVNFTLKETIYSRAILNPFTPLAVAGAALIVAGISYELWYRTTR